MPQALAPGHCAGVRPSDGPGLPRLPVGQWGQGATLPFPEPGRWASLFVTVKSEEKAEAEGSNTEPQERPHH